MLLAKLFLYFNQIILFEIIIKIKIKTKIFIIKN